MAIFEAAYLAFDEANVARRGLLIRHLVLPEGLAGTEQTLTFIAEEVSRATCLNLMGLYRPCFQASRFPGLDRCPNRSELHEASAIDKRLGLHRLD